MAKEITNDELKLLLSKKLALLRENSTQTIEAAADSLDMDFSEYYRLLRGQRLPHLRTLLRINQKYGVNMDWWFSDLAEILPREKARINSKIDEYELLSNYKKLNRQTKEIVQDILKNLIRNRKYRN